MQVKLTDTDFGNVMDDEPPDGACMNYESCGNMTPGAKNVICDECLDALRHNDA